ncbi:hypothetical protein FITA111629_14465 [Filibacter tadaridae]|uniref:Uncharacterized protein n=1 Tax=Filibacter tadaridae TaxID=2483811 RepID=A0A3P5X6U2_9BACL|nr:hypothetical protein [Filibacter tadaridae]VDC24027.1 hypothetical protein FILTAD_00992 [Filibacter tadaridae]
MREYRILRHVTKKEFLGSIISDGALMGDYVQRTMDKGYISFESNPTNDTLLEVFHILKDWEGTELFELIFDGERLIQAGYEIRPTINGVSYIKEEIDHAMKTKGLREVSHEIGDYVFINGNVPLKFLTSSSKKEIEKWASENNMIELEVKSTLYNWA